jgi:hypothetical protein
VEAKSEIMTEVDMLQVGVDFDHLVIERVAKKLGWNYVRIKQ